MFYDSEIVKGYYKMMGYSEVFYNKLEILAKILILLELFDEYYRGQRYIANKKRKNIKGKNTVKKNIQEKSHEKNKKQTDKNNKKQNNKPLKKSKDLTYGNSEKYKVKTPQKSKHKEVVTEETFTSKIPVVIAEKRVYIPVEIAIELEEEALEIKRSSHDVYLNEATLIPIEDNKQKKGKLFLKGFVRNSLEYSTVKHINNTIISGKIKHSIIYIPFKCTAVIDYSFPPNFYVKDNVKEIVLNVSNSSDDNQHISISEQDTKFSEQICCNINKAKISGTRIYSKKPLSDKFKLESVFSKLREKMIVELSLTLTQRQCVNMIN